MNEHAPSLRMIDAILDHIATFLDEAGCPLTAEQRAAFDDAQAEARQSAAGAA